MAAGKSRRYGVLKQFEKLSTNKNFLFEFSVFDAVSEGFSTVIIITSTEGKKILSEHFKQAKLKFIDLKIVIQDVSDFPFGNSQDRFTNWGTAHAIWSARAIVNEKFVVINADDFYGSASFKLGRKFIQNNPDDYTYGLVTYTLGATLSTNGGVSRGVCLSEKNALKAIKSYKKIVKKGQSIVDELSGESLSSNMLVSMNFWVFDPTIFDIIYAQFHDFFYSEAYCSKSEIDIPDVVSKAISDNFVKTKIFQTNEPWFGLTYSSDKAVVEEKLNNLIAKHVYPSPLWD